MSLIGTPREEWRAFVDGVKWRRKRDVEVGQSPYMPADALEHFSAALADARVYVEFGSGGSTVLASKTADRVVCVETDAEYLHAVQVTVGDCPAEVDFLHADIGRTAEWGTPLVRLGTNQQRERWVRYPWTPWPPLDGLAPDLVMIDGRFRVASAAIALLHLGPDGRLLFDDYLDRPFYWALDAIADRVAEAGRLVEFRRRESVSEHDLRRVADAFRADWR